ncbi:MAG: hypothetical protein U9R01_07815 [candidate division WOR-3 bacterium]|nr:hypothetical protein [candidate division WOR-3 bacterium]
MLRMLCWMEKLCVLRGIGRKYGEQLRGMDMKNVRSAKSANYSQIDNQVEKISESKEAVILPSLKAYEKLKWTRDYFEQKPEEGILYG